MPTRKGDVVVHHVNQRYAAVCSQNASLDSITLRGDAVLGEEAASERRLERGTLVVARPHAAVPAVAAIRAPEPAAIAPASPE